MACRYRLTACYHIIDKTGKWSSTVATDFAFTIGSSPLGIRMCTSGLTYFPSVPFVADGALVVAVFIVHVAASSTSPGFA